MVSVPPETAQAYRDAWEGWSKQLVAVHDVLLEGAAMTPDRLKGLLGREARAFEKYEAARQKLLGLDTPLPTGDENPFR